MNERIRKLMEESGLYIAYENKAVTEKELQFFAELIVQEVLTYQETLVSEGHNAWRLNEPTKKHFGVEE